MSRLDDKDPDARNAATGGAWAGVAGVGAIALTVGCCGGVPLFAALAGGAAVGAFVGIGAGAAVLAALIGFVMLRARRRSACASPDHASEHSPEQRRQSRPAERAR
jgi:hypothetical protein